MIKIERSFPAPESLATERQKNNGKYNKEDVVAQLKEDFHDKCYICGLKELQDPQVEHLLPHHDGKYPERKFDWENLFWSCGHCNSVKKANKYEGNVIDCCKVDPEKKLNFQLQENRVIVTPKTSTDNKAMYTAELMVEVFSKNTTGLQDIKSEHRLNALKLEMNAFYSSLEEYQDGRAKPIAKRKMKALLSRESAFAEFKRDFIRTHISSYQELEQYL